MTVCQSIMIKVSQHHPHSFSANYLYCNNWQKKKQMVLRYGSDTFRIWFRYIQKKLLHVPIHLQKYRRKSSLVKQCPPMVFSKLIANIQVFFITSRSNITSVIWVSLRQSFRVQNDVKHSKYANSFLGMLLYLYFPKF